MKQNFKNTHNRNTYKTLNFFGVFAALGIFSTTSILFFQNCAGHLSGAETFSAQGQASLSPSSNTPTTTTPPSLTNTRVVVPISQTVLTDGTIRYSVPIKIGNTTVQAQLDTGSTGVRVLPGVLAPTDYSPTTQSSTYAYGSGVSLTGIIGNALVSVGNSQTSTTIPIEIVQTVGCITSKPKCPASILSLQDYGIGGDGLKGQGFKAIIGVGFRIADAKNPLTAMGSQQWIIDLPALQSTTAGNLIINPSNSEITSYQNQVSLTATTKGGWFDNSLPGCLKNLSTNISTCNDTLLDSGNTDFLISTAQSFQPENLPVGTNFEFNITETNELNSEMKLDFSTQGGPGQSVIFQATSGGTSTTNTGFLPFLFFKVFYDFNQGLIGFLAR